MTNAELKLQEMFWEYLKDHTPVPEWGRTYPSWNDGGQYVVTIWEGPGCHYRTRYSDWCVEHPDTTIELIERVEVKKWVEETRWSKKYSETHS